MARIDALIQSKRRMPISSSRNDQNLLILIVQMQTVRTDIVSIDAFGT